LRNGISGQTASADTPDEAAMVSDLSVLVGLVSAAAGSSEIVIVAAPRQASAIRIRQPNFPYPVFSSSGLEWDFSNPKGHTSTACMSTLEFAAWCRAGKPELERSQPEPEPQRPVSATMTPEEQRPWDAWLEVHLLNIVDVVASESGAYARKLREDMKREIAALRMEIVGLRKQRELINDAEPLDLPDLREWRSHVQQ
jgi:hypothetical protein